MSRLLNSPSLWRNEAWLYGLTGRSLFLCLFPTSDIVALSCTRQGESRQQAYGSPIAPGMRPLSITESTLSPRRVEPGRMPKVRAFWPAMRLYASAEAQAAQADGHESRGARAGDARHEGSVERKE